MEELNKNNETLLDSDIAAEKTQGSAPDAENMAAGAAAGVAGPYNSKKKFGPLHITVVCLALVCVLLIGLLGWQITRMNKVYSFIGENSGTDLTDWTPTGVMQGNHPIYDDSAVVKAYKNGSDKGLSDKDAYVLKAAKSVIDEVIKDGMTDYEKELAIYNWQFGYTHYNDSAFAPIGSENHGDEGSESVGGNDTVAFDAGNADDDNTDAAQTSASESGSVTMNADTGEMIGVSAGNGVQSVTTTASSGNMDGETAAAAKDDPICKEDPYKENYDYEPYGVLKYGSYICVGNATTFKLFMDMLDIPCQIIHSTEQGEHAWDLVQIDGDWYHVDLTFDGGSKTPTYSNFNVPDDVKLDSGYPWDTTKFPAADSVKYCYAVMNAVDVSDIYKLPSMIRQAIDDKKGSVSVRFGSSVTITENDLSNILDQMSSYYGDAYFYAQKAEYVTNEQLYVIQFDIYSDDADNSDEADGSDEPRYDYDKMSEAISESFSDVQASPSHASLG